MMRQKQGNAMTLGGSTINRIWSDRQKDGSFVSMYTVLACMLVVDLAY